MALWVLLLGNGLGAGAACALRGEAVGAAEPRSAQAAMWAPMLGVRHGRPSTDCGGRSEATSMARARQAPHRRLATQQMSLLTRGFRRMRYSRSVLCVGTFPFGQSFTPCEWDMFGACCGGRDCAMVWSMRGGYCLVSCFGLRWGSARSSHCLDAVKSRFIRREGCGVLGSVSRVGSFLPIGGYRVFVLALHRCGAWQLLRWPRAQRCPPPWR